MNRYADRAAWQADVARSEDITPFVREQHARLNTAGVDALATPREDVYPCLPSSQVGADT